MIVVQPSKRFNCLWCDGANRESIEAVDTIATIGVFTTEIEIESAIVIFCVLHSQPVVATIVAVEEERTVATATSRQEDAATAWTSELASVDAIHLSPFRRAMGEQFICLCVSRHLPRDFPQIVCCIVLRSADATAQVVTRVPHAIAMDVCAPVIDRLPFRFPPGIVATSLFGSSGAHIATRPFRARRQAEVDEVRVSIVGTSKIRNVTIENDVHKNHDIQ